MSRDQLIALKEYIKENQYKGFIQASSSPAGAPMLFIKQGIAPSDSGWTPEASTK